MNSTLLFIEEFSGSWAEAMVRASLGGTVALLLAWLICTWFPKLPPAFKCWIWRLVYLKLLLALVWAAPVPLPVLRPSPRPQIAIQTLPDQPLSQVRVQNASTTPRSPVQVERNPDPRPATPNASLMVVWLCGVFLVGVRLSLQWNATRRLRSHCSPLSSLSVAMAYGQLAKQLSIAHPPPLLVCDDILSPLLLGTARPVIVIPPSVLDCGPSSLKMMLAHELAHFRRHETQWALVPMLARVLFWFHPLVWLAERELTVCQESACDDAVLRATQSPPAEYGRLLLQLVMAQTSRSKDLIAVAVVSSRSTLHRRLIAMRHINTWSFRRRMFAACLLAFVGVCGAVPWKLTTQESKTTAQRAVEIDTMTRPAIPDSAPARHEAGKQYTAPGYLVTDSASLRAGRDGIAKVFCTEGDRVKKGQLLAEFDVPRLEAAVSQAEAQLQRDQAETKRKETLFKKDAIAISEMEEARAVLQIAQAELVMRRQEVEASKVYASLDGMITNSSVHEGEFVAKGDRLFTIVSLDHPKALCDVPADVCMKLGVGERVEFKTIAYPQRFTGRISFISPQGDAASNTFGIRAILDDPSHSLRSGMQGEVSVWVK